jgi:hypothetical protein
MQEQKIVMGIPEFRMDTTSIELHVPEFTMKTHEIIMGLPQVTLKSVSGEVHNIEDRADAAKSSMDQDITRERDTFRHDAKEQMTKSANTLFTCIRTQLQNKKTEATALLDPVITMLRDTVSKLSSINSDETRARASESQKQLDQAVQKSLPVRLKQGGLLCS